MKPEPCWYCGRAPAEYLCDYRLGSVLEHVEGSAQLALGEPPPAPREVVATCDAGACRSCYMRCGWRQVSGLIVCMRGRGRGRGCHSSSVDHCHLHAAAETRGSDAWLGAAGVELARADARSACVRLAGGTARCQNLEGSVSST